MRHFPDEIGRLRTPSCRSQKVGIIKCKSRADRSKPVGLLVRPRITAVGTLDLIIGPGPDFPVGTEIPVIWTIFSGFNGQTAPNRRTAMAEHVAGGQTRSPTGLLRSARDLHFIIPTF